MASIEERSESKPFWVGIGASAGGLEVIKEFFKAVPARNGLIWVVIQHLSPDYKSMMRELLSSSTDMPIRLAEEGVIAEPNTIYLIKPNTNLRVSSQGQFTLEEQHRDYAKPNLPIDLFFESMADFAGKRSIGVVLSGTGSDGTRGARRIRERGGFVIVQSLETAAFDGMPKSIITNDLADVVDQVDALPSHVIAFASPLFEQGFDYGGAREHPKRSPLDKLFLLLLERFKVDFSAYKPATVGRRIERRVQKCRKSSLEDYVHFAATTPTEVDALFSELLIGVTSFFRDRDSCEESIRKQFSDYVELLEAPKTMRAWVPGCSSGEEAYTLAIIFSEVCEKLEVDAKLKIFATDIDSAALSKASAGTYPVSIMNDVPGDLLAKYFVPKGDTYTISNRIREMVVFAKHDLLRDPPFTKLDFVSCRNLLIYLSPPLQSQILSNFNFSLKPGGLMQLGISESLGDAEQLFDTLDKKAKIFRSIGVRPRRTIQNSLRQKTLGDNLHELLPRRNTASRVSQLEHTASEQLKVFQSLADVMGSSGILPFSLLVDSEHNVMRVLGTMPEVFKPVTGTLESEVTKLLIKELQVPVSSGLSRAFRSGEAIRFRNIVIKDAGKGIDHSYILSLTIVPFTSGLSVTAPNYALIVLSRADEPYNQEAVGLIDADQEVRTRVSDLEHELQLTRENLQTTIEELETSNEELQSTNEELLSSNEELQSTNEELQSVNEELYTVNNEHQERLDALSRMRTDFSLLLDARDLSVIYLDAIGNIISYTPGAVRVFNLLDQDIGRPLSHISSQITEFDVGQTTLEVLRTGQRFDQTVSVPQTGKYLISIYTNAEQAVDEKLGILVLERLESIQNE